ncbi:hypothetical protein PYK22_00688 [Pyrinomonas methylaliphatogenes]|uniref:Uncharacterized protein n=1 Tax=Pyrinomonas methylaliphatogenes TaxID=454194 RepID=A0A0B6WTZ1_9BACT|nr:hypothetical protein PYK22_00688 [Pyrinomonas methylaliphatogenes]
MIISLASDPVPSKAILGVPVRWLSSASLPETGASRAILGVPVSVLQSALITPRSGAEREMEIGVYRREYGAYWAEKGRREFERLLGRGSSDEEPLHERFADLWTREALDRLAQHLESAPEGAATERLALERLVSAVRFLRLEEAARPVSEELARCERAASKRWEEACDEIAEESDVFRRRALALKALNALGPCDDLRCARYALFDEEARILGSANHLALREAALPTAFSALVAVADRFLERTAEVYAARLREHLQAEAAYAPDLSYADELRFRRLAPFDGLFPAEGLDVIWRAAVEALHVKLDRLADLVVEIGPEGAKEAACFAVDPPRDVRLVVGRSGGLSRYLRLFSEVGRAQYFVWLSPEMADRYPEFVYAPERATEQGHAALFRHLWLDPRWITEHRGLTPTEAQAVARAVALLELHDARRRCALLRVFTETVGGTNVGEAQKESYASSLSEATGFRYEQATFWLDIEAGWDAVTELRAQCFALIWRDRLRTRYGRAWWRSRRARDELIDVWNTGARYHLEELAPLIGAGELDYESMAEMMVEALQVG